MKENNKTKYLLGLSLLGIWGLLGFRFYEKAHRNDTLTLVPSHSTSQIPREKEVFEYALSSNYTDPFKKNISRKSAEKISLPQRPLSQKINLSNNKKGKVIKFPRVEYKGKIVDKKGNKTAIVKVDKEFLNLNLFQQHGDIQITQIFADSIIIRKEGMEKTIVR